MGCIRKLGSIFAFAVAIVPIPASAITFDYSTTTQAGGPHDAYGGEFDCNDTDFLAGNFGGDGFFCGGDARTGFYNEANVNEASDAAYTAISLSDDAWGQTADPGAGDNAFVRFEIYTDFDVTDAMNMSDLTILVEGLQGNTATDDWYVFVWDYTQGQYLRLNDLATASGLDEIITETLTDTFVDANGVSLGALADLVDTANNGQMTLMAANLDTSDWLRIDAFSLDITLVPEPDTAALLGLGLLGLAIQGRRRR
jgi:uncharacterized protein (TIGR03382 family)